MGILPSVDWFGLYYTNVESSASVKPNELPDYPFAGERVMHRCFREYLKTLPKHRLEDS